MITTTKANYIQLLNVGDKRSSKLKPPQSPLSFSPSKLKPQPQFSLLSWFSNASIYFNILLFVILFGLLISVFAIIILWFSSSSSLSLSSQSHFSPSIGGFSFSQLSFGRFGQFASGNTDRDHHLNSFILCDVNDAPQVVIDDLFSQSTPTNSTCNHYNCFDVYRCGNHHMNSGSGKNDERIAIYIYPIKRYVDSSGVLINSPFSDEYWQLLDAILNSPYYTSDPEKACIFMPSLDLLSQAYVRLEETSQILASLPYWQENGDGSNHLLFNMIPGSFPDYNTRLDVNIGKAIIAGGGFNPWTFRPTFDISIPVYSPLSASHVKYEDQYLIAKERVWLVTSTQLSAINSNLKRILNELEEQHDDEFTAFSSICDNSGNITNMRCNERKKIQLEYPSILTESTFCLYMRTAYLGSPLLSDILMSACIPVVVSDSYVLPFEDKIDWARVAIRIYEHSLPNLINILKSVSDERIIQMRQQTLFVWKQYFSSMKAIGMSTLEILNDRLFPQTAKTREEWNQSTLPQLKKSIALVNPKLSHRPSVGFTAVILTYDRLESLYDVINQVIQAPSCSKVLVVWNNQKKKPPSLEKWPKINVALKIIQTKENRLSNRFYPYEDIETDALLAIDDDIVMLTPDELEFGFQVWREFPDRIVGFPSRVHRWDNSTARWKYESEWTNDVSMVLTGAAFYHKYYNYLYTTTMPDEIKSWVDEQMNCEDIAMNFLVSNVTGKAPIKVAPRKKFKCPECINVEMLSADVLRHLTERSDCINRFASIYGTMPLKTVEFRADPVLFKDNLPEKLKKFNQIGSL